MEFVLVVMMYLGGYPVLTLELPTDDCDKKAEEVAPILNRAGFKFLHSACWRNV